MTTGTTTDLQPAIDRARSRSLAAGLSSAAVMLLTSLHHAYGAAIYRTPWRLHVVHVAVLATLFISGALIAFARDPRSKLGRASLWIAVLGIAAIPVALIGAVEGAYNHLLKNILYFAGLPLSAMARLYPPPAYELPNDFLFEASGLLQVPLAALAAHYAYRLARPPRP